ncbi:SusE domain-containing protein [uncultured Mucilaginibacter sp.]|uniref:SusE domain-containing protein n=1 Tax=uncultured Mucilaginibacter sp. TaxID=797541 RepID=UPI002635DD07|nr:SusE domain-containing protein [uncultured Mucilaginibacter sp.]
MRKIFMISMMLLFGAIAFTSCKKDVHVLDANVAPVSKLNLPADQASFSLDPKSSSGIVFQWDASSTQDLVLYEIAFDKPTGDFSNPIYKVLSNGSGVQTQATISQKLLNTIAFTAGIASSSTGTLKWTVIVSKVANKQLSTSSRIIQINRPAGFAVLPAALYLTGTATEAGADVTKAIAMKKVTDGVFELYTSLQPGTYTLVDKNSGTSTVYSVQNGTSVQLNGSTTVTGNKAVYRISIDLTTASATLTQILSVGFWSAPLGKITFMLPYVGNSQWETNTTIVIPQQSYGLDSRYKYQFMVADASGKQSLEWYGSKNPDNPDPNSTTLPSYFYMYPVDNSQFNYCFKLLPATNNKNCTVNVNFSPAIANYNNTVTIK